MSSSEENNKLPDGAVRVLDKGFVRLHESLGNDQLIAEAARISYSGGTKRKRSDEGLIRFLIRHSHGTPLEMPTFIFHIKAPIFVLREWHRHRVGISINEISARYSELSAECYLPDLNRIQEQSKTNKQGSGDLLDFEKRNSIRNSMADNQGLAFDTYKGYLEDNIARELARINLPLSTYSEMYWKCNLRSLFHFCGLRMAKTAQLEIREYAKTMFELVKPICPVATEAFEDYVLNAITLSKQELQLIKQLFGLENQTLDDSERIDYFQEENPTLSKREVRELKEKLGL